MGLRAVLLDIDGTLIDSNDAHARAWIDVLTEFGFGERPFEHVRPLIGMGGDKVVPALTRWKHDGRNGKRITTRRFEIFRRRYLPKIRAFAGSRDLVARFRAEGLLVVIATSAGEDEMKTLLDVAGVADLISTATSSEDAEQSKPDPDIILAALERVRVRSAEAIMIGDTPYDVGAATRAGVRTIALRCGGWWSDDALGDAVEIYDSPAALLAGYARSTLAGKQAAAR